MRKTPLLISKKIYIRNFLIFVPCQSNSIGLDFLSMKKERLYGLSEMIYFPFGLNQKKEKFKANLIFLEFYIPFHCKIKGSRTRYLFYRHSTSLEFLKKIK